MGSILDDRASDHVANYNACCLHYNLVADALYTAQRSHDSLSLEFEPYLIAGLIGFDMSRMMGDRNKAYSTRDGFGARLSRCLQNARPHLERLRAAGDLASAELAASRSDIENAYRSLAVRGTLHATKSFDVGATKILHWLFPQLLIMLDQNVARAFKSRLGVEFRNTTQPGYCPERYLECLDRAQREIRRFGENRFRGLEPNTPVARVFDKIAFMVGTSRVV
jgi:hypothetical protein